MYDENQAQSSIHIGSGSVGYGQKEQQTRPLAPVLDEYGVLGKELELLAELVDNFRVRLEPVLGCDVPEMSEGTKSSMAEKSLSPLGESIRSDTRLVRNIAAQLRNLLQRIEV